jgi:flagellin
LTGVTAKVNATAKAAAVAATSFKGTASGDVLINGVDIGAIQATSVVLTGTPTSAEQLLQNAISRGTQVAAAINAKTSQTGVTAIAETVTGGSGETATIAGRVKLTAADGRNITVTTTKNGAAETGLAATTPTSIAATAAVSAGTAIASGFTINGVTIGAITATTGASIPADHSAKIVAAINAKMSETGVYATVASDTITLNSANGQAIIVAGSSVANLAAATTAAAVSTPTTQTAETTTSTITLSTNGDKGIVVGGSTGASFTGQKVGFNASVLSSSGGVDLSTAAGSIAALTVLDKAINTVTDSRASMGAYQNRLTASISNLEVTSMNLQASRSRILDTDYAKETTNLAKSQIIQQAATAMLAQANQSSQSVLSLLK